MYSQFKCGNFFGNLVLEKLARGQIAKDCRVAQT